MPKHLPAVPQRERSLWTVAPYTSVLFVLAFAGRRGALVVLPLLALAAFVFSPHPFRIIGAAAALYALILVAAALSGLVFAAVGHRLLRVPWVGDLLGFSLSAFPYTGALAYAMAVAKGAPWRSLPGGEVWVVATFVAVLIGGVFAHVRRSEDKA